MGVRRKENESSATAISFEDIASPKSLTKVNHLQVVARNQMM